jgi:hypothetical protein
MSFAVLAIPEFDRDDADDENAGTVIPFLEKVH